MHLQSSIPKTLLTASSYAERGTCALAPVKAKRRWPERKRLERPELDLVDRRTARLVAIRRASCRKSIAVVGCTDSDSEPPVRVERKMLVVVGYNDCMACDMIDLSMRKLMAALTRLKRTSIGCCRGIVETGWNESTGLDYAELYLDTCSCLVGPCCRRCYRDDLGERGDGSCNKDREGKVD